MTNEELLYMSKEYNQPKRETPEAFKEHMKKPGEGGRKLGAKNKSTVEREQEYLRKLTESDLPYKLINKLIERVDSDEIRTSEIIKAISTINSYFIRTIDQADTVEIVKAITTKEQAENKISEFRDTLTILRAVK